MSYPHSFPTIPNGDDVIKKIQNRELRDVTYCTQSLIMDQRLEHMQAKNYKYVK